MADLGVFSRYKGFNDFQDDAQKNSLAQALQVAQIQKLATPDIEDLGKQAFLKASQKIPLTDQENAALQYLDSKSQTIGFNPVTGAMEQKPGLLDRAGIQTASLNAPATTPAPLTVSPSFKAALGGAPQQGSGDFLADVAPQDANPYETEYQQQLKNLTGNPKAQQELTTAYQKQKLLPNEDQSKNAGYAQRMDVSAPIIDSEAATNASMDNTPQRLDRNLPDFIANQFVGKDFQSAKQAQLDFLNAILRKESGAAISTGEYTSYAKQYFPQPGDSPETVAQKAANRQAALQGVRNSAGPSYRPVKVTMPATPAAAKDAFNASKIQTISSPSDPAFAKLPSGAKFKGADGVVRVKH